VLSFDQAKSKEYKGVIRSVAKDYDKKEITFELSEKKKTNITLLKPRR
jgi:hypothetical protein